MKIINLFGYTISTPFKHGWRKFFITFFILTECLEASAQTPQAHYPEIEFKYDWRSYVMDIIGGLYFGTPVTEDMNKQFDNQLPKFVNTWTKDAPIFFGEVFSVFKQGIQAKNRTAIINLSHKNSYGSHRFLVFGLQKFFDSEPWVLSASREDAFSSLVFHELLHVWIDENLNKELSHILTKYCNEDSSVLDHLHLMAIQKMVYTNTNRSDMLELMNELYQGPIYGRSWEIVNNIEGYEAVLQDIVLRKVL